LTGVLNRSDKMRSAKKELNVDFIGGQEPLTAAEAAAISNYLQAKKKQTRSEASNTKEKQKISTVSG